MKEFYIKMPFTGVLGKTINAETEEEALQIFHDTATFPNTQCVLDTDCEIEQWEFCETIVKGNVFYGVQNEMEIEDNGNLENDEL